MMVIQFASYWFDRNLNMSDCKVEQVVPVVGKGFGAISLGVSGAFLYLAIRLLKGHDGPGSFANLEDWEKKEASLTCINASASMLLTACAMFRFSSFPKNGNLLPIVTDRKLFLILLGMIGSFAVISNVFFAIQCMTGDCHDVSENKRKSMIGSYFFSAGMAVATQVGVTLSIPSCMPEQRTAALIAALAITENTTPDDVDIELNPMHAAMV
jgi:hypothetical protein